MSENTTNQGQAAEAAASVDVWLTLEDTPRSEWAYPVHTEPQIIGRSRYCDIVVNDSTVSREHAVVWRRGGVPYIRDLKSINGTRVNNQRISSSPIQPGDLVQLGQAKLRVCRAEERPGDTLVQVRSMHETAVAKPNGAGEPFGPTSLEESAMRDDLAAIYSLGGALGLCSDRGEALQYLADWLRDRLGAEQAAAVFYLDGRLQVVARSSKRASGAPANIHWPAIRAGMKKQQLVTRELPRDEAGSRSWTDRPPQVLVAWIPGVHPPGVIYGEWTHSDTVWEKRCRELLDSAARVLGDALVRLGGGEPRGAGAGEALLGDAAGMLVGGPAIDPVREFIRRAAAVDATVLITGETGTGKELVARAIHEQSVRAKCPFVTRNCGAFPEFLLENELFGHEPGAFTGATKLQKGVFDEANHGTLVLDEIAEMPLAQQSKLLRVLEEKCFQRVGGQQSVLVDVRIIAATNRDLTRAVTVSQFRRDLYYRLDVLSINLPPLRERPGDVRLLAEHLARSACARWELPEAQLTEAALRRLEVHNWPGNVRELQNTIDRAVVLSRGGRVDAEHVVIIETPDFTSEAQTVSVRLDDIERAHILQVLASVAGNKTKAATLLGIDRSTLIRKLQRADQPSTLPAAD